MEQSVASLWICVLAIVHPRVCVDPESSPPPPPDRLPSLSRMNNEFAFKLYRTLLKIPEFQSRNIIFSPFLVSMTLSQLSSGAAGETKQQLLTGLGYNSSSINSTEEMHQMFLRLLQELEQKNVAVGSVFFYRHLSQVFLKKMEKLYHSEGFPVDFRLESTKDLMNSYVKNKTRGEIDEAVQDLDPDLNMLLLSYIYFKGQWNMPFDANKTYDDQFHVNNATVPVRMMYRVDSFQSHYDAELSTKVLRLDYNDTFSMLLALPDKNFRDLENNVSAKHLKKWMAKATPRDISVCVPKLSLKTSYPLTEILRGLGMVDMFSSKANFTEISKERAFILKVTHKASLEIEEEGATAAAVIATRFGPLTLDSTKIYEFNRPFMIFIIDQKRENILFFVKIFNPKEKQ